MYTYIYIYGYMRSCFHKGCSRTGKSEFSTAGERLAVWCDAFLLKMKANGKLLDLQKFLVHEELEKFKEVKTAEWPWLKNEVLEPVAHEAQRVPIKPAR